MIKPGEYARWRASAVGGLTERLEQDAIFELAGDLHGRSVLDVGCGDGTYSISACHKIRKMAAKLVAARAGGSKLNQ